MKNQYSRVTLLGSDEGVAMIDNNRLLINVRDSRLREALWGTADKSGIANITIDSIEEDMITFTIHKESTGNNNGS